MKIEVYCLHAVTVNSLVKNTACLLLCSTIENYKSEKHGFDGLAALASLGNFFKVFFGAFALGCGMGCVTALVLLFTVP